MWLSTFTILGLTAPSLTSAIPHYLEALSPRSEAATEKRMTAASVAILAQFNFEPFTLTNIGLDCQRTNTTADYHCSLKFDWHDPNSVRQNNVSSCTCNQTWTWDGVSVIGGESRDLNTPYEPCWQDDTSYFAMRLSMFHEPGNFTLQLAHQYHDSENFTAPWDYPTTFAEPTVVMPVVEKTENRIKLQSEGIVNGTIIGISD